MATPWSMEGHWFKNCNCNPGCPCDFNQLPTHDRCEGIVAMRIEKGHFGSVDLTGLHWAGVVRWPGAMYQGNGNLQPIVDAKANARQRAALLAIMSGRHGDTMFEIIAAVCPNVQPPVFVPFELSLDAEDAIVTSIMSFGAVSFDLASLHASTTYVKHGNEVVTGAKPVVAA
jgi:hypothetical protein